jgi:hypothetical protein
MILTAKSRKKIAASVPENDREPQSQMMDRILRDYWRMKSPSKLNLLRSYRDRCDDGVGKDWLASHCVFAEFAESIIAPTSEQHG